MPSVDKEFQSNAEIDHIADEKWGYIFMFAATKTVRVRWGYG
jgi:hypothetical protein